MSTRILEQLHYMVLFGGTKHLGAVHLVQLFLFRSIPFGPTGEWFELTVIPLSPMPYISVIYYVGGSRQYTAPIQFSIRHLLPPPKFVQGGYHCTKLRHLKMLDASVCGNFPSLGARGKNDRECWFNPVWCIVTDIAEQT
jgi:hypothetical protein